MSSSWLVACLPALGLEIVRVDVFALGDRRDHLSNVFAVLDNCIAGSQIAQRHLVPYGDRLFRREHEI